MLRRPATLLAALGACLALAGPAGAAGDLDGTVIVVDPGHNPGNAAHTAQINRTVFAGVSGGGGRKACDTTGTATASGYSEAAFNWDVSRRVAARLRARGATVVLTRTATRPAFGPCIDRRAEIGNRARADAAISIHADGGPSSGRGFFLIAPSGPIASTGLTARDVADDAALALAVRDAYRAATGMPYSDYIGTEGVYRSNEYGGTNLSRVPKVFIETGNMRNATDAALLQSPRFRERIAAGIAVGLARYVTG